MWIFATNNEAQLPLTEHGVSLVNSAHHSAILSVVSLVIDPYVTCGIFFYKNACNGRMRVYENSTSSCLTCFLLKNDRVYLHKKVYRHKLQSMLNNLVVSFYDNFGLIFKRSEDEATNGIENCSFDHTTSCLLTPPPFLCTDCQFLA